MSFDIQKKWFAEVAPTNTKSATAEIGSGDDGTITVTIDDYGTEGNDFTIAVVEGVGNDVEMSAVLTVKDVVVTLGTGGAGALDGAKNTATLITAEIDALAGMSAEASGTGATALDSAEAEKNFADGVYATVAPVPFTMLLIGGFYYVNIAPNSREDSNWRKFQLASF